MTEMSSNKAETLKQVVDYRRVPYIEIYRSIREQSRLKDYRDGMLAGHFLTRDIGRFCSAWFVKHRIIPNQITLLMIIFGIVGSIFFALPNVWCKIVGYLCWLMWFAMDCSDGQVARYTKIFSKYGTEMDYMAHLIDHPLMNLAIWFTFIQMNIMDPIWLSAIFMICISAELITRSLIMFNHYDLLIYNKNIKIDKKRPTYFKYFFGNILLYPTYIVCFSWIIIIDYKINIGFSIYLLGIWLVVYMIMLIRAVYITLNKFYRG